jgi:protein tyrosine/serine phosphatase
MIGGSALASVVLGAGLYLGAHALEQENPFLNLEVVEPGVLLRSAQPRLGDIERLHQEYGVQTILSLRDGEDAEVIGYAQANGLDWVILKMKADDPPTPEQVALFLDLVEGKPVDLDRYAGVIQRCSRQGPGQVVFGRPVLMHCEGGADRSGVLTALFRIEFQGFSLEEAKQDMLGHWHLWFMHPRLFRYLDQYHPQKKD